MIDESRAVLAGVAVTATEVTTGRRYVLVTDKQGKYQLPNLPPGAYNIRAELSGFATVIVSDFELLVGQNATLPITMKVAALQVTVSVTAEAALVDTRSSAIADNVDRRQMEELPILGRNWMELALHIRGITANNIELRPGTQRQDEFQLNLDGQQVTQKISGSDRGQPRFSREATAEFQIVTNLFDVTQGRSSAVQVQAVSRSGTNTLHRSVYANFRDDALNAADPVAGRVLPVANQQVGGSIGVRLSATFLFHIRVRTGAQHDLLPARAIPQPVLHVREQENGDKPARTPRSQSLARDHLAVRVSRWNFRQPFELGSGAHPSQALSRTRPSTNILGTWTRVLGDTMVQEIKVGYNAFDWTDRLAFPKMASTPQFVFPGLVVGGQRNFPQQFHQDEFSTRYALVWHLGRHELKIGGDYIWWRDTAVRELVSRGEFIFSRGPSDLERRFPASSFDDPAGWDLTGLDALVRRFDRNFGDWTVDIPRPTWAVWFGDTWVTERLTMNYGLRSDVDWGVLAPPGEYRPATFDPVGGVPHNSPPFRPTSIAINAGDNLFRTDMRDLNNVAPRVGFAGRAKETSKIVLAGC